jgi:hypothetical protein
MPLAQRLEAEVVTAVVAGAAAALWSEASLAFWLNIQAASTSRLVAGII